MSGTCEKRWATSGTLWATESCGMVYVRGLHNQAECAVAYNLVPGRLIIGADVVA